MRILVFGAGALGSVFAGFLSRRNDVAVVARERHVNAINSRGLHVTGIWGEHWFEGIEACASPQELSMDREFELVLITTKSYDTERAARSILPLLRSSETAVLSMQNGIGNEERIAGIVGAERTMGGMAIFGARALGAGHVEVTVYASPCLVGELNGRASPRAKRIATVLSEAGIPTQVSTNIVRDKWMKAFYNIALNPLSAILAVPYGVLGEMEETRSIMKALLKEAFEVALKLGVPLETDWQGYYHHLLNSQLPPTAMHRSSMLQDIELGRRTEIDYLNGAIARLGRELGVETPANSLMTSLIHALERSGGGG